jgi:hypothetical protein
LRAARYLERLAEPSLAGITRDGWAALRKAARCVEPPLENVGW